MESAETRSPRESTKSPDSGRAPSPRRARIEEIIALRHAVLRPGLPPESADFAGDRDPASRHFGIFDAAGAAACASLMLNAWEDEPAWQLRGMATRPDLQRRGLGGRLLHFMEADLRAGAPTLLLWCNARVGAAPFYARHGWRTASEVFDIEGVGSHYKMVKRIPTG